MKTFLIIAIFALCIQGCSNPDYNKEMWKTQIEFNKTVVKFMDASINTNKAQLKFNQQCIDQFNIILKEVDKK